MRFPQALAIVACVGLLSATSPLNPRRASATPATADTTIVAQMSTSTKAFDLGGSGVVVPALGWDVARFNDSSWENADPVGPNGVGCARITLKNITGLHFYYGGNPADQYAFRIKFTVPWAVSYAGSTITYVANANALELGFDGSPLIKPYQQVTTPKTIPVEAYVEPGPNVVILWASPPRLCAPVVNIRVVIHAHGVSAPQPAPPSAPTVTLAFPPDNAIVTGTALPLSWQPFLHAAAYLVRVWLVQADAGQAVTASTVATTAKTVLGAQTAISTARMLKGQYRWDIAALNPAGQLITAWSVPRSLQLK